MRFTRPPRFGTEHPGRRRGSLAALAGDAATVSPKHGTTSWAPTLHAQT
jgi:hypothetical protein